MTEDSDEDNPVSFPAAFIDRITAYLRRLGTRLEVAPEEPAHHPAGTGGAVSLAAVADSAETGSAAPETESSTIQCPVCLDSLSEIKSRGKISELYILSSVLTPTTFRPGAGLHGVRPRVLRAVSGRVSPQPRPLPHVQGEAGAWEVPPHLPLLKWIFLNGYF